MQPPPWKIKVVEPIALREPEHRRRAIAAAGCNTFLLRSDDVFIDLLTDSGTSALSQEQRAAMELGDEAYAGSRSFFRLEQAVHDVYGWRHLIPTHQGRGAEHLLSRLLIRAGAARALEPLLHHLARARRAGGRGVGRRLDRRGVAIPNPAYPFKGNIDVEALERVLAAPAADRVAFVRQEACLNMAGGQPFSIENLRRCARSRASSACR